MSCTHAYGFECAVHSTGCRGIVCERTQPRNGTTMLKGGTVSDSVRKADGPTASLTSRSQSSLTSICPARQGVGDRLQPRQPSSDKCD